MNKSSEEEFNLIGNDYNLEEIKNWYDEEEKYHNQFTSGRNSADDYWIIYEVFNRKYAIDKFTKLTSESNVLSFGCAEGSDTAKLLKDYNFNLYGIEASDELIKAFENYFPKAKVRKAEIDGTINYPDNFFDYIFCFGVLHHIPNVSKILSEFKRVLKPGGVMILREPVCWMYSGENRPKDLSPNERGIPVSFFKNEFEKLDFDVIEIQKSFYKPLMSLLRRVNILSQFPNAVYFLDRIMCKLPSTDSYYVKNFIDRFSPSSAYYIVKKKI